MAFHKTGDAEIETVRCSCGGEIDPITQKCKQCGKDYKKKLDTEKETTNPDIPSPGLVH